MTNSAQTTQTSAPDAPVKSTDLFAAIASTMPAFAREGLAEPTEPGCPAVSLPLDPAGPRPPRRPRAAKIETTSQLHAALEELRESTRPFLDNHAPPLPDTRPRFALEEFQWRVETLSDLANFSAALAGEGEWETVRIPHYGPPLGRACTLYRTTFDLAEDVLASERIALCFSAVDYRCKAYLNGVCLGTHEGFFEAFEFDATGVTRRQGNVLVVRVENDHTMLGEAFNDVQADGDKIYAATGLGYDDPQEGWHHCPPGMGIWQPVRVEGRSRLHIADIFVRPLPDLDAVEIRVEIEKANVGPEEEIGLLVSIYGQNFPARVQVDHLHRGLGICERGFGDLDHGVDESKPLAMGSGRNYLSLTLPIPEGRRWDLDTPWLYQAQIRLVDNQGALLDAAARQFGLRTFTQDENSTPRGKFYLNGREIRLRGANTMGNLDMCVFRGDFDQLRDDILLAKLTNLNFLRLTQHPVQREVYEYCDRLGLLLQTDLPLFATIRRNQFLECVRQAAAMERHVRCHPSNALVSFINEPFPASRGKPHRFIDRDDMEVFFDIATKVVRRENPDRVVKCVDGDYDPPARSGMSDNHCYCGWYIGHGVDLGRLHHGGWLPVKEGWHYGCGEFGSEGLDSLAVMQEFYPDSWLPRTLDSLWEPSVIPKAQTMDFHRLWYPTPRTVDGWIEASQHHQEWITRLMTEALRRKAGMNTFAIHLFIDAWPAGWMKTIMDVNRVPKRAWFAYRDALSPLAVSLRTDRTAGFSGDTISVELWICNDLDAAQGCRVEYEVLHHGQCIGHGSTAAKVERCAPTAQGIIEITLPEVDERGSITVGATVLNSDGEPLHDTEIAVDVFPLHAGDPGKVCVAGNTDGAHSLIESLGMEIDDSPLEEAAVILIADPESYFTARESISNAVRRGATAVFLALPAGEYPIGSSRVKVSQAGMGPRHYVDCSTGHAIIRDFGPQDFKFWFDETCGYVSPILRTVLETDEDWTPILQTGNGGWSQKWGPVPAAAELSDGLGIWRVCQVDLVNRVETNPAARIFANRLLGQTLNNNRSKRDARQITHVHS